MKTFINDNRREWFAVLDIEMLNLTDAFAAYEKLDPRAARLRWPFRSACAAALLTFSVSEEGEFEFGHLDSWVGDDEAALLRALFNRLKMLPDHRVCTWGGLSADLPILRLSAMEHGLCLPDQLVHDARRHGRWLHLDLAKEMKAGSGSYVHLSEIATRLRLPVKFADRASMVPTLMGSGKLRRIADIAIADVLTTSLVLASHLEIHSELAGAKAAQIRLLEEVAKARPEARFCEYLERVAKRMLTETIASAEALAA